MQAGIHYIGCAFLRYSNNSIRKKYDVGKTHSGKVRKQERRVEDKGADYSTHKAAEVEVCGRVESVGAGGWGEFSDIPRRQRTSPGR